jgi:hypothetical protein
MCFIEHMCRGKSQLAYKTMRPHFFCAIRARFNYRRTVMDSDSNATRIISICVSTATVATLFLCMRFYTRLILIKYVGWEDWVMLIAGVCYPLRYAISHFNAQISRYLDWPPLSL